MLSRLARRARLGHRRNGQSVAEFALVMPVFLLVVLMGLDFGRAFESWIRIQQSARVAANFASVNPTAWNTPGSASLQAQYQTLVLNESAGLDCALSGPIAPPAFPSGTGVGLPVTATVTCGFNILTPIISAILPSPLTLSARASFPIRTGAVTGVTTPGNPPAATFTTSPSPPTGNSPLTVTFTDQSSGKPTAWCWNFGDGPAKPTCDATTKNTAHTYTCFSGTCLYTASLMTTSVHGSSAWSSITVTVTAPPPAVASFTTAPSPASGTPPLLVQFTDTSTGGPTTWCWNFGDSSAWPACDTTLRNPSHNFPVVGTFTVRLCAYNPGGPSAPCSSPATATVTVANAAPPPNAAFHFSPTTGFVPPNLTVLFTDDSLNSPTTWSWSFGAGQGTSTLRNPSYTYTTAGTFTITLTATNPSGSSSISHSITLSTPMCTTPNFAGMSVVGSSAVQAINSLWASQSFTGTLGWYSLPLPNNGNHKVLTYANGGQTLSPGSSQNCSSAITLKYS